MVADIELGWEEEEKRTLGSRFSARVRLLSLGVAMWGLWVGVYSKGPAPVTGLERETVVLALGLLLVVFGVTLVLHLRKLQPPGRRGLDGFAALSLGLVLIAAILFFTARRHEAFPPTPPSLRLVSDIFFSLGCILAVFSIVLLIVGDRWWRFSSTTSLWLAGIGLAATAAPNRNLLSSLPFFWTQWENVLVRTLEEVGFASWILLSLFMTGWDRRRVRRIGLACGWIFTASTILLLFDLFRKLFHTVPWYLDEITSVGASAVTVYVGRIAWYCLLLFLVSMAAAGIRAFRKGRSSEWVFRAGSLVPIVVTLAMLAQVWSRAYGNRVSLGLPAIWIPAIASISILVCWKRLDQAGPRSTAFVAAMASFSVIGVACWMWVRGPGLMYGWRLSHGMWRLMLRRFVPIALFAGAFFGCVHAYTAYRTPSPIAPKTSGRRIPIKAMLGVSAPIFSGALILACLADLSARLWLTIGSPMNILSATSMTLLLVSAVGFAGSIYAWRTLAALLSPD